MKSILASIAISIFLVGSAGYMHDVDAKGRVGGGKSSGMQRESVKKDATPPATAAPAATKPGAPTVAPAAPQPASGMSRWLGPLAGLAAGGLLASLFMGGGFGGLKLFDIVLMIGLAVGVFMLVRMFMRKKAADAPGGTGNMEYARADGAFNPPPAPASLPSDAPRQADVASDRTAVPGTRFTPDIGSRISGGNASADLIAEATTHPRIPADFEVAPFERNSKAAFIRMQAANDAKDLNDIREFTTPEMFGEIALQLQERGAAAQKTEVVSVDARVIEVIVENQKAIASVRYTGVIRENAEPAEGFDEVWNVVKDLGDTNATWKLAGIQQLD